MIRILNYSIEKKLEYDGNVILIYNIQYPHISGMECNVQSKNFNIYNRTKALNLQARSEGELFEEAKRLYEYNKQNGYPIMTYEIYLTYQVTFNNNEIVSLYTDQYEYAGGAHGNTIRESQNWNLRLGTLIPLSCFYKNNPSYVLDIIREINKQIKEQIEAGNDYYFENYCSLVVETLNLNNYYLIPGYIVIFFQQYDIAPYSTGIPTFKIKNSNPMN